VAARGRALLKRGMMCDHLREMERDRRDFPA